MRLPVIKSVTQFIEANDEDYVIETMEVLEHLAENGKLKDEEIDVIGELLSNMSGAIEVAKLIREGETPSKALNQFMSRVMGSFDPKTEDS